MIDLAPFKSDIETICTDLSLRRLDLIGSAAPDDFSETSDIDVLVTFEGDEDLFERYFSLKECLTQCSSVRSILSKRELLGIHFSEGPSLEIGAKCMERDINSWLCAICGEAS